MAFVGAALAGLSAFARLMRAPDTITSTPAAISSAPIAAAPRAADAEPAMFMMRQGQWRFWKLIGLSVYDNGNEDVGDINEIIFSPVGRTAAGVIGIGGF